MDIIVSSIAIIMAVIIIVLIAFPHLLAVNASEKTEKVGPAYWGVYDGQPTDEPEAFKQIEIKKSGAREQVVAGSATYAKGRGTSFRM